MFSQDVARLVYQAVDIFNHQVIILENGWPSVGDRCHEDEHSEAPDTRQATRQRSHVRGCLGYRLTNSVDKRSYI